MARDGGRGRPPIVRTAAVIAGLLCPPASFAEDLVDSSATATWEGEQSEERLGYAAATGDVDGDGRVDLLLAAPSAGEGSVSFYTGSEGGFTEVATSSVLGLNGGDYFGRVLTSGDMNGDGARDFASLGGEDYGQYVSVYLGAATGPEHLLDLSRDGATDFGAQLAAGDVTGDGLADLFVGSPNIDTSPTAELLGYFGSASGPGSEPDWTGSWCGAATEYVPAACALAAAGDVDGDGFADLVAGSNSGLDVGAASLRLGSEAGPSDPDSLEAGDPSSGGRFGTVVAALGDVNGDGFADFGVGDPSYYDGADASRFGRIYVYLGASTTLHDYASILAPDRGASGFGWSAAGVDVDGDGFDEVVVGAPSTDDYSAGTTFIFDGGSGGVYDVPAQVLVGDGTREAFGWGVLSAGDENEDGGQELLVLAPFAGDDYQGRAYLFEGISATAPDADGDGYVASTDCNDADANVHPGAEESCNGVDDDCDGEVDEDAVDAAAWATDADGDAYTVGEATASCSQPAGMAEPSVDEDCDDTDSDVHPGAAEIPDDGIDQDCDGEDEAGADTADSGGTGDTKTPRDTDCGCNSEGGGTGAALIGLAVSVLPLVRRRSRGVREVRRWAP